jgi:hypothetical protein
MGKLAYTLKNVLDLITWQRLREKSPPVKRCHAGV